MIEIAEELKQLYRTDCFPYRASPVEKEMYIEIVEDGITFTSEQMEQENFTLEESICENDELLFGSCEATKVSFALYEAPENLKGKTIRIWQEVEEKYILPLGTYVIHSVVKRDAAPKWRDIEAYDRSTILDKDCTAWYNAVWIGNNSVTLEQFRKSFFNWIGLEIEEQTLPNDNMIITKNLDPTYIIGRTIAQSIGEINGLFGHITREGRFKYFGLSSLGLYPSETLFPSYDLFPAESSEIVYAENTPYYPDESHYEDYMVKSIDSLIIKNEEGNDILAVGEKKENPYVIQGNFLVYGKTTIEIKEIAEKLLLGIKGKYYRPHTTKMIGLPYLEAGDSVAIITDNGTIESFIFSRILTGINAFEDELSATGNEYRLNEASLDVQIEQANGKIDNLEDNVEDFKTETEENMEGLKKEIINTTEQFSVALSDTRNDLQSRISQTAEQISIELSNTKNNLQSQISMQAGEIVLKVDHNGKLVQVELGNDAQLGSTLKLQADNISLEGLTTINGGFRVLADGTMECENGIMNRCKFREGIYYRIQYSNGTEQDIPIITSEHGQIFWGLRNDENIENVFKRMVRFEDTVHINAPLFYNGTLLDSKFMSSFDKSGSENTITGASYSNGTLRLSTGFRCTFSGTSSSSTPNARVSSGGNVAQTSSSSKRYKENIKELQDKELDPHKLYEIPIWQYTYKEGYLDNKDERYGKTFLGFIAEEVADKFPLAVDHLEDGRPEMWNINILFPALTKLVQEQKQEIDELKELLKQKGVID